MAGKCGGLGETKKADGEIQKFCDDLKKNVESKADKTFAEFSAVSYKSQVVAGTNYFVKVRTGDGTFIHIRIFMPLPHTGDAASLHSHQLNKTEEEEIVYF